MFFCGLKVDNFGLLEKEWFNEKMKIDDILRRVANKDMIEIEYWRGKKLHKKSFKYSPFELAINTKFPIYEKYENKYEVLGGMIIMELTVNHLQYIVSRLLHKLSKTDHVTKKVNNILSYLDTEKRTKPRLIVTHVFPNSYLNNLEMLEDYDILDKVNGKKCSTITEFRNALLGRKSKYIEILTELNKKVVLEIPKIVEEEDTFATTYKYPISDTFKKLKKIKFTKRRVKSSKKKNKEKLVFAKSPQTI